MSCILRTGFTTGRRKAKSEQNRSAAEMRNEFHCCPLHNRRVDGTVYNARTAAFVFAMRAELKPSLAPVAQKATK